MRPLFAIGASLAVAAIAPASADTIRPAEPIRSIEYFIMHNAERAQQDHLCARGGGRAVECQNAQRADSYMLMAESQHQVSAGRYGIGSVESPAYFSANPIARMMTLNECAHPTTQIRPSATSCQAARISAGQ